MSTDAASLTEKLMSPLGIFMGLIFVVFMAIAWVLGLLEVWTMSEEYGHGLMAAALVVYLVYQRWDDRPGLSSGSLVLTIILALFALLLLVASKFSGISVFGYYALWGLSVTLAYSVGGFSLLRFLLVPFLIVLLLIPLPNPIGANLTAQLQLWSSMFGVWFLRLFGASVYLEGNVLDMGTTQLLVAEACAGLRYLFPLMSLGAIAGYMLNAALWVRWAVFLVTIPITVFMNSLRIAVTGILVDMGNEEHTEGFLHFFEGWVVFIVAFIILVGFTWLLVRIATDHDSLMEAITYKKPASGSVLDSVAELSENSPAIGRIGILLGIAVVALGATLMLGQKDFVIPEKQPLNDFPSEIAGWKSRVNRLPSIVEATAGASEYYYGDFQNDQGKMINAYISYYETQRHGQVPHSPKVCLPGGGWQIQSNTPVIITGWHGGDFQANRLLIGQGEQKILTYYWLKQGDTMFNDEIKARFDLIRFAAIESRTDGALIRLVTNIARTETMEDADRRLSGFAAQFVKYLSDYLPD